MNNIDKHLRKMMVVWLILTLALVFLFAAMWLQGNVYYPVVLVIVIAMISSSFLIMEPLRDSITFTHNELQRENNKVKAINSDLEGITRNMVHDLKSPLRSMGSFAQLASRRMPEGEEEIKEYLTYITNNANRMSHLLDAISDYSKINSDKYMKEKVVMDDLIDEVKMNVLDMINQKNVGVVSFNLPVVCANKFQLMQVLQNLLENAIKYNNKECPQVVLSGEETESEYIISVKDNGIGIEDDYKEKVFELFERLNPHLYEGTGVGLAICKKIVENHKGRIWLESTEGEGTTFYFTLPKPKTIKLTNTKGIGLNTKNSIAS